MRAKTTSLLIALAMLLPTAAVASDWDCDKRMISEPCLDEEQPDDPAPVIASACCCDIRGAGDRSITDEPPAVEPTKEDEIRAVTVAVTLWPERPTVHDHSRTPAKARAPPPHTLFSQHIALIC